MRVYRTLFARYEKHLLFMFRLFCELGSAPDDLVKHSLAHTDSLPLFIFLEKRVRDSSDVRLYAIDMFIRSILNENYELTLYLFGKYRFSCATSGFSAFCVEKGYDIVDRQENMKQFALRLS